MAIDDVLIKSSVARAWSADSDYQWVRFRSSTRGPSALLAIRAWSTDLYDRLRETGREYADPGFTDAFETDPRTVIIGLDRASSEQALFVELDKLRQFLVAAGCAGVIENAPSAKPLLYPTMTSSLYSVAVSGSLALPTSPGHQSAGRIHRMDVDQNALHAVIDHALTWCSVPGGTYQVRINLYRFNVSLDQLGSLLHRLLPVNYDHISVVSSAYPQRSRAVTFTYDGRVTYAEGDGNAPAEGEYAVTLVTEVLAGISSHISYGFGLKTQGMVMANTSRLLSQSWPDRRWNLTWEGLRNWETAGGWDAYAVLLHGPDFDRLADSSQYLVHDLPKGRQLLIHHDARRWIDGRNLTTDELPVAREALGDTLINLDRVRAAIADGSA